jgi:high-affinity Fe2+/Pb2+ permease
MASTEDFQIRFEAEVDIVKAQESYEETDDRVAGVMSEQMSEAMDRLDRLHMENKALFLKLASLQSDVIQGYLESIPSRDSAVRHCRDKEI